MQGREARDDGAVCIIMAHSSCCMAETNITLQKFKTQDIKKFFKQKLLWWSSG